MDCDKKYILIIVEGKNDEKELQAILHSLCFAFYATKYITHIVPTHGDITTKPRATIGTVKTELNQVLNQFRKRGPIPNIKNNDIQEIVQIVDLDGTYLGWDNVRRGGTSDFFYEDEYILTTNVDNVIGRNKKKAEILNELANLKQIGGINYSCYFVSCNMDHLLFNCRNLSWDEKKNNADRFRLLLQKNPEILEESLFSPDIMSENDYYESWNKMRVGTNSLQRKTNLNLFFTDAAKNYK